MKNINNIISPNINNQSVETPTFSPPNKSNISKYLFILCFLILLASIAYSVFLLTKINFELSTIKTENNVSQITPTTIPTEVVEEVTLTKTPTDFNKTFDQIYQQIKKENPTLTVSKKQNQLSWWISDDYLNISIPTNLYFEIKFPNQKSGVINTDLNQSLVKKIENILLENNFKIDKNNSAVDDSVTNKFYAYKSNNIKCLTKLVLENTLPPPDQQLTFSCFTDNQLKTAYEKQLPFSKVIFPNGNKDFEIGIGDIKINNDKATLKLDSRNGQRGYGYAYVYKKDNQWFKIFMGNDVASCSQFEEKGIPKEYWIPCVK